MSTEPVDLVDLTRDETRALLASLGEPAYRGDQVFRWVHARRVEDAALMSDLGKALRERLGALVQARPLVEDLAQVSRDGTRKLRLRTHDAHAIETVLIPDAGAGIEEAIDEEPGEEEPVAPGSDTIPGYVMRPRKPKLTQCISSQVGCALDCDFCATAKLGFGRQLTAGEIVAQVYRARTLIAGLDASDVTRRAGADHVTNLVYMGMGEPLHNIDGVTRSLAILCDEMGAAISPRRITVSTAGMVPGIAKLGALPSRVRANLAVSLNASNDEVRDRIMPINKKWPIAELLAAVRAFPLEKRRRVTFEYVLLDGVNDTAADARRLPRLLAGIPCKVNVIPFNPHPLSPYRRPSENAVRRFQDELRAAGLAVYLRRPRGDDIDAACGQLAAQVEGGGAIVPLRKRPLPMQKTT